MLGRSAIRLNQLTNAMRFGVSQGESLVLFETQKNVQKVILNRPKALNALDIPTLEVLLSKLRTEWRENQQIKALLFTGAGGKAFCAGGDIKTLYDAKISGDPTKMKVLDEFFHREFLTDYGMSKLKPFQICFYDGIVMGGGVGISSQCRYRIATETSMYAMPEAKIGLFTDIGASYFLPRLRGRLGLWLGLTGARLRGEELVKVGVADYFVPREHLPLLEKALIEEINPSTDDKQLKTIITRYTKAVPPEYPNEKLVDELFKGETLQEIVTRIEQRRGESDFIEAMAKSISEASPISLRIIFEQYRRGKQLKSFREGLVSDFRVMQHFMAGRDFFEGVRCTLIDKKDKPNWTYKSIDQISEQEINRQFEPLDPSKELDLKEFD
eukprot:TRINITY_DN22154_c0_g1_i1.p1 TRINITY_DN22154_c0_g1~~TRINITY_DN22154_c0_g1_i1.p1  ORF type:complete len:384 (+),score=120.09 TRINITY_DN22154_c0_g1_i1:120-1271(+)